MKTILAILEDRKGFIKQIITPFEREIRVPIRTQIKAFVEPDDIQVCDKIDSIVFYFEEWIEYGKKAKFIQYDTKDGIAAIETEGDRQYKELINIVLPRHGELAMTKFLDAGFSMPVFVDNLLAEHRNEFLK